MYKLEHHSNENRLKLLTRQHYNKYPFIEPNIRQNKKFLEQNEMFLNLIPVQNMKEPIIEVGCGSGKYLKLLEMAGKKNMVGIDIAPKELEIARDYLEYSKLEEADATDLRKFKDNSYSTVICAGVAHHTPFPRKVFDECARICKKNGLIIFAVYRKYSIYYYDYSLASKAVKLVFQLRIEKMFYPIFRLWFVFLNGRSWFNNSIFDDKTLVSSVTDRYVSPVVKFFSAEEIIKWINENNLSLMKQSSVCRNSVMTFLVKK